MEFDIQSITARAFLDYVGPPFPEWWQNNRLKYQLPDLSVINSNQLKGGKYFMTLSLVHNNMVFDLPNEPLRMLL